MGSTTDRQSSPGQAAQMPLVSVMFPVYNGADYLKEAIESIINQTYKNFELIIINDGSTDDSAKIIRNYTDPRIRYHEQANRGLAATLNHAIEFSKGKYLARQDQDDIALPHRFEKQVAFLEAQPSCGMVGTWAQIWEVNKPTTRAHKHPSDNVSLKFELLFDNPFVHSSLMIRRDVLRTVGLYSTDKSRQPPEDYELWSRIARKYEVANIPEILQVYREMPQSMSRTGHNPFLDRVIYISAENLAWITRRHATDKNVLDLACLAHAAYYLVSSKPNFNEISRILREAADAIDGSEKGALHGRVKTHLDTIRYHYLICRYGKIAVRFLALWERLVKGIQIT